MIIAQMATIPGREEIMPLARKSLNHQVDEVKVFWPPLQHGTKFRGVSTYKDDDIIFICDDDLLYPPDYVSTMLKYLEPGMVVTCLGKIMKPRPIKSYYQDTEKSYKTFDENTELIKVDVGGTGVMAFHQSTCPDLDESAIKSINMDIEFAIYCKLRYIPIYVIPHPANWLGDLFLMLPVDSPSIYKTYKDNDQEMTNLINECL